MSEFKDKLIEIYSSCSLSEIKKNSDYQELCEQHDKKRSFDSFRSDIEQIKECIEGMVEMQGSVRGEVSESLTIISMLMNKYNKKEEILNYGRKLIIKTCSENWNHEQLEYFKTISDKITTTDYDYFLSFTRRKSQPEYYNIVNNNYEHFIKDTLGEHLFTHEDRIEKNLLAKSIHRILRDNGYGGFFYPENIADNKKVDPKIKAACENSHIFIQIIQNIMFKKPDVENYCFKEYKYANTTLFGEQIIFVLAEGSRKKFIRRHNISIDYINWHKDVLEKDIAVLKHITQKQDCPKIYTEIEEKICNKIKDYKQQLIDNVP